MQRYPSGNLGNALLSASDLIYNMLFSVDSIKCKATGVFSHNNISVYLGTFIYSDTLPAKYTNLNLLQNSTCAARNLGAKA